MNINRQGDLTVVDGYMQRVSIGPAWGGAPIWGGGYIGFNLRREWSTGNWSFLNDGGSNDGGVIYKSGNSLLFSLKSSTGATNGNITDAQVAANVVFRINDDGKVVIGNSAGSSPAFSNMPNGYKLFVDDGILTEKVRVAIYNTASWSDFVFAPDYQLMPLKQIEAYISQNGHLPGIPSAEEVVKEGLDLATMDAKLLQKVEELTLHLIELQKQNEQLQERIQCLELQNQ